jgi:hypothetical protein
MFDCIVSLTSWKGRINHPDLPKVLFSIINQKTKYNCHIVFVLSLEEFPNKEKDLPQLLLDIIDYSKIEIIWTQDNLKAYKKLYPVQKLYPNIPIMTTDDDIILNSDIVETYMNEYTKNPKNILTEIGHSLNKYCRSVGFTFRMFRLFPPNSLFDLDSSYFVKFFNKNDDDAYMAVLAWLKHTNIKSMRTNKAHEIQNNDYKSTALRNQYKKQSPDKCGINLVNALKKEGKI